VGSAHPPSRGNAAPTTSPCPNQTCRDGQLEAIVWPRKVARTTEVRHPHRQQHRRPRAETVSSFSRGLGTGAQLPLIGPSCDPAATASPGRFSRRASGARRSRVTRTEWPLGKAFRRSTTAHEGIALTRGAPDLAATADELASFIEAKLASARHACGSPAQYRRPPAASSPDVARQRSGCARAGSSSPVPPLVQDRVDLVAHLVAGGGAVNS
jgi:hypothetical protein